MYHPRESAVADTDDPAEIARLQQRQRAARKEWDGAIFEAPDGAKYITIVQLAGKLGCPEHQLRRFDRELGVRRVSDVFGSNPPSLGRAKLKSKTRLYELGDQLGDEGRPSRQGSSSAGSAIHLQTARPVASPEPGSVRSTRSQRARCNTGKSKES